MLSQNKINFSILLISATLLKSSLSIDPITYKDFPNHSTVIDLQEYQTNTKKSVCSECNLAFGGSLSYKNSTVDSYYLDLSSKYGCVEEDFENLITGDNNSNDNTQVDKNYYVIIKRGECDFQNKSQNLYNYNQKLKNENKYIFNGILLLSSSVMTPGNTTADAINHNLLLCTMYEPCYQKYKKTNTKVVESYSQSYKFDIYALEESMLSQNWFFKYGAFIDSSFIMILAIICMICSTIYLKAIIRYTNEKLKENRKKKLQRIENGESPSDDDEDTSDLLENNEELSAIKIVGMLIYASIFLTLLYFLYKYVVYLLLGMFTLVMASVVILFFYHMIMLNCPKFYKFMEGLGSFHFPNFCRYLCCNCSSQEDQTITTNTSSDDDNTQLSPQNKNSSNECSTEMSYFELILFIFGFSIAITYMIFRHSDWSWILLDSIGFMMCVIIPTQIKVNNLSLMTFLLGGFFFYDIFMVFITPYVTPKGESIMVEVATGAGTGEQLPLLFKVPKLALQPFFRTCGRDYSMLGFGDIIIPGICTSFCVRIDLLLKNRRIFKSYTFWAIISYAIGLFSCLIALHISKMGQPALLYICPSMLLSCYLVAFFRGEVKQIWSYGTKMPDEMIRKNGQNLNRKGWQICSEENQSLTGRQNSVNVQDVEG